MESKMFPGLEIKEIAVVKARPDRCPGSLFFSSTVFSKTNNPLSPGLVPIPLKQCYYFFGKSAVGKKLFRNFSSPEPQKYKLFTFLSAFPAYCCCFSTPADEKKKTSM